MSSCGCWFAPLPIRIPANVLGKAAEDGPALAITVPWGMKQQMEDFSLCLSTSLSITQPFKQINLFLKKDMTHEGLNPLGLKFAI